MTLLKLFFLLLVIFIQSDAEESSKKPNVIVVVVDDWGYNDLGYNNNSNTDTEFLTSFAKDGIILASYYTLPQCTSSRSSLLTGRHSFRYGLQQRNLEASDSYGLSTSERLLSQEFKDAGYSTHIVGKWHLGFASWEYTPTYRGFDTFAGFYNGDIDYFNYNHSDLSTGYNGLDLREGTNQANITMNQYSVRWQFEKAQELLDDLKDQEEPFFLYLAWQASHFPSEGDPYYMSIYYTDNATLGRAAFQAQTTSVDDYMEEFVSKLKENGLWDNTILVFSSDNGASPVNGDNSPLRGAKSTIWEGGIRVPGFIQGGYLNDSRRSTVVHDVIHVTDWYPTLLTAAGVTPTGRLPLDGTDMWDLIQTGTITDDQRNRVIVLNIDSTGCSNSFCGAIRWRNYKLIWTDAELKYQDIDCIWSRQFAVSLHDILACGPIPSDVTEDCLTSCATVGCLFDINTDPCEYYNLANDNPAMLQYMKSLLINWNGTEVTIPTRFHSKTSLANPSMYNGYWTPFLTSNAFLFEEWMASLSNDNVEDTSSENTIESVYHMQQGSTVATRNWLAYVIMMLLIIGIAYLVHKQCKKEKITLPTSTQSTENTPLINSI